MENSFTFRPPRLRGWLVLGGLSLLDLALAVLLYQRASGSEYSSSFLLYLLLTLLAVSPLPILVIRMYYLYRAFYFIERDGLRLQWGNRIEDIALPDILWIKDADDLAETLRFPLFSLPGAVIGRRIHPELGSVEFFASRKKGIVLIGTANQVFAFSPADPNSFKSIYRQLAEMGSLSPIIPQSLYPALVLNELLDNKKVRILLLAAAALNAVLIAAVSISVPSHPQVHLGYTPQGLPGEPLPGVQLFLLPLMSVLVWLADFIMALILFQRVDRKPLAMILLIAGNISTALLILAVFLFIR